MFTVKQIVGNATSLYEVPEVTIARKGSAQWDQAWALADDLDLITPDIIESSPAIFTDALCKECLAEEQINTVTRTDVAPDDCIAIIITSHASAVAASLPEVGGSCYQFIYNVDQVYIMNTAGSTIEAVNRNS